MQVASFEGHTADVTCLLVFGDRLVSGARDGKLMVWDFKECFMQVSGKWVSIGSLDARTKCHCWRA
mgnify:CR=1 FL=1